MCLSVTGNTLHIVLILLLRVCMLYTLPQVLLFFFSVNHIQGFGVIPGHKNTHCYSYCAFMFLQWNILFVKPKVRSCDLIHCVDKLLYNNCIVFPPAELLSLPTGEVIHTSVWSIVVLNHFFCIFFRSTQDREETEREERIFCLI